MDMTVFIAYCSPAGSTRKAARMIQSILKQNKATVHIFDMGKEKNADGFIQALADAKQRSLFFVGSPVYRDVAIPPVTDFLSKLPRSKGMFAFPFVTWGKACSGIALWQLGQILLAKGFKLAGGAKILGEHSMMWTSENIPGQGHPDDRDEAILAKALPKLLGTCKLDGTFPVLDPDELINYQPEDIRDTLKEKVDAPLMVIPKTLDEDRCNLCGICAEACPVSAISLTPFPEFNHRCFGCFTCVRECPEMAFEPAVSLKKIKAMILERIDTINEIPNTQVFLPA